MAPTRDRAELGPVIRVAALDDVAAIGVLHARSQRTAYADLLPPEALSRIDDDDWILTWTQRFGSAGTRAVLVAERHHDLLGLALTTREPTPWATLNALHVHPESYRQGVGTALLDAVIEQGPMLGPLPDAALGAARELPSATLLRAPRVAARRSRRRPRHRRTSGGDGALHPRPPRPRRRVSPAPGQLPTQQKATVASDDSAQVGQGRWRGSGAVRDDQAQGPDVLGLPAQVTEPLVPGPVSQIGGQPT